MTRTAFILGGTGLIGRALVPELLGADWHVTVASRNSPPDDVQWADDINHVAIDRDNQSLREFVSDCDAFIDVVAYEPDAARQLLEIQDRVGTFIVISTMSVYADEQGRSMDTTERPGDFPDFLQAIPESQGVVEAGSATYSSKKIAIEGTLLAKAAIPVTIVRPGLIYGPGDKASREWFFIKRVTDARHKLVLSYRGATPVSVVASRNLAQLIRLAAEAPATRIINAADPEAQTPRSIGNTIAKLFDHEWDEVLLDGHSPQEPVGDTPWSVPRPLVADITRAREELAYQPRATYEDALRETCEWLLSATTNKEWEEVLPGAHRYYGSLFDYAAEDQFLSNLR
jgi:nucleoside-diphosphate-sugar epimerase